MPSDPEIDAMRAVADTLKTLDTHQRSRVLRWAWARFVPWSLLGPHYQLDEWNEPAEESDAEPAEID